MSSNLLYECSILILAIAKKLYEGFEAANKNETHLYEQFVTENGCIVPQGKPLACRGICNMLFSAVYNIFLGVMTFMCLCECSCEEQTTFHFSYPISNFFSNPLH